MDNPTGKIQSLIASDGDLRAVVEVDVSAACPRCAAGKGCGAGLFTGSNRKRRVEAIVGDHIPPAIGATREYQTLQALVNCTRRSLLPESDTPSLDIHQRREQWESRIRALEAMGIR